MVLAVGFSVERFLPQQGEVSSVPLGPDRGELIELYDQLGGALGRDAGVVVILPRRWREQVERRLQTVQLAAGGRPFAFYPSDSPPLAGAVLAGLAAALAPYIRLPGLLAAALPVIERELIWVTWLKSLGGVRGLPTSFGQRAASLLPGRSYAVSNWPEPTVHRVRERIPTPPLPELLAPFHLAVAPRGGDADWAHAVAAGLGDVPSKQYEPTPLGPDWWGVADLVETVAYPVALDALAEHASSGLVPSRCRWCGETVAASPCPFCRHAKGPIRGRRPDEERLGARAVAA